MIRYKSTRGENNLSTFSEVILKGIAPDGGLFVPEKIPTISQEELQQLKNKSYHQIAEFVFKKFQTDFSTDEIKTIVEKAYGPQFDTKEITPLVHLKNNQYILELWHGPTAAFKDMALQIMPLFFSEAIEKNNKKRVVSGEKPLHYIILAATSGDTGKAALEGYKNKNHVSIIVFYPDGKVSQIQQLQMQTQVGNNVAVFAVKGDFDDTQRLVKNIFNDKPFNEELQQQYQTILSSANSINWGRLIPQIVYHFKSYVDLVEKNVIRFGDEINVCIPSGNFGNLIAAYYAKRMGLPIRKFLCASNENNVLTQFLQTGTYSVKNRKIVQTSSPSMDILIANNIERLLSLITNNPQQVATWMRTRKITGEFSIDEKTKKVIQKEFFADWVTNDDCLTNLQQQFVEQKYLMDPHTSVAHVVAERYLQSYKETIPMIIYSTAHWAKFPQDVAKALGIQKKHNDVFTLIQEICSQDQTIKAPESLTSLEQKQQRFTESVTTNQESIEELIRKINAKSEVI